MYQESCIDLRSCDTPPMSIAIFLHKYALFLVGDDIYTTHLHHDALSGPLDWLNAILSLLQPLDRYRAPSAIGSPIGRAPSRPISHPRTGGSPQPRCSKPLGGLNRAIVVR